MEKDLKKHVAAIRITDKVGLLPRKIWNIFLLNAYNDLIDKQTHSISYTTLCEISGCNSKNTKHLEESLIKLCSVAIQWDINGKCAKSGSWSPNMAVSSMLAFAEITDGIVTYEFSSGLSKLLYQPEMYQKISLAQQRLFKTSYSLALWENCIRFVGIGRTGFSDLNEWRELIGATHKSYDAFKVLNQKILQPAIKEINTVSSIEIELVSRKMGRRISEISFNVKEKKQIQLAVPEVINELKSSKEYEDLINLGIQQIQAIAWIQEYGNKYLREQIDFVKEEHAKGKIKSSLAGFLVSAVKGQYKNEKQVEKERQEKERLKRKAIQKEEKKKEVMDKAGLTFSKIEKDKYINELSEEEKNNLLHEILEEIALDSFAVSHVKKKGLASPSAALCIIRKIDNFAEKKKQFIDEKLTELGLID